MRAPVEVLGRIRAALTRLSQLDYAVVMLSLVYFILYNYVNLQIPNRVPFSPDENGNLASLEMLNANGSLVWTSFLNQKYGVAFFRPRLFTEVAPNRYVTGNSIGFVLLLALAARSPMLPFIVPIIAVAGVLGSYAATAEVLDRKAGIFVAATVGIMPTFVFFSNSYMDIIPSFSFFILSILAFLRYMKDPKNREIVMCALLLAISIFLRPYNALFLVGYVGAIVLERKRLPLNSLIIGTLSFLVFVTPVFLVNQYAYGEPLSIGFISPENLTPVVSQRVGFDIYGTAFMNYVAMLMPILFLLAVFGAIITWRHVRNETEKVLLMTLFLISGAAFVAFGSQSHTYGFYIVTPEGSLARYLMPVYFLLAYCAYRFVRRLHDLGMKRLSIILVSVLMISLVAGNLASNALPSLVSAEQKYSEVVNVIRSLPDNSVIFTRTYDKLVFPIRYVAILYTNSDLANNPDWKNIVPIVDIDKDVIPVIQKLLQDGFHVYLAPDVDDLADHLARAGYTVSWIDTGYGLGPFLREVSISAGLTVGSMQTQLPAPAKAFEFMNRQAQERHARWAGSVVLKGN